MTAANSITRPSYCGLSKRSVTRGFTLVELLVVIGIIAVLISILLPAFGIAQQAAKQTSCLSNLRTMGQAVQMYLNENNNYYPGHCHKNAAGKTYAIWPVRLRHYLGGNQGVFWCPAQNVAYQWQVTPDGAAAVAEPANSGEDSQYGYNPGEQLLDVSTVQFSYGYNDWGTTGAFSRDGVPDDQLGFGGDIAFASESPPYHELNASRVRHPDQVIMITDKHSTGTWNFNIDPTDSTQCPYAIHAKGANCLYADGHADWHLQQDIVLFDVRTAPQYTNPTSTSKATPYAKFSAQWNAAAPSWNNNNLP